MCMRPVITRAVHTMSQQSSCGGVKFIDIGANLTDPVFYGRYRGKQAHDNDFEQMRQRATDVGMDRMMVTAGDFDDISEAGKLVENDPTLFTTVGIHPCRAQDFEHYADPLEKLKEKALEGKKKGDVVAIGECGLDYDRLNFCPKDVQLRHFPKHFELTEITGLPMFLHNRASSDDFLEILRKHRDQFSTGVVHSFTGSKEDVEHFLDLGLYIGINGCSMKTEENLEVIKTIPLDRLMIETDAPWCEIRASHAGSKFVRTKWPSKKKEKWEPGVTVKGRCEPCHIIQVAEVASHIRGEDFEEFCNTVYENTEKVFFPE